QHDVTVAHPEREFHQVVLILLLAPQIEVLAGRTVTEGILPVDRGHDLLDVARREAARVEPADPRAQAGAGDRIDRYVHLLEHFEDADMGGAARAAAGEHQTDPRTMMQRR